ncbi:hypothetical protein AK812_SmicGene21959 [Symbiodinium microadriaticum]|uniref:Uncharacterized protein n=1 Tax=Symbiodinium microadriaticum TaxID=2951 RepID=A0A1Q9DL19_SYMMI|nr:hypothetical protein AK812_SmicGene21959 [Symbiodinium microadriaticum]
MRALFVAMSIVYQSHACTKQAASSDLRRAAQVDPENAEIKRELDKVRLRQKEADEKNRAVYERMIRTQQS